MLVIYEDNTFHVRDDQRNWHRGLSQSQAEVFATADQIEQARDFAWRAAHSRPVEFNGQFYRSGPHITTLENMLEILTEDFGWTEHEAEALLRIARAVYRAEQQIAARPTMGIVG